MYEKNGIVTSPVVDANNASIGTRKTLLSRKEVNVEAIFSFVTRTLSTGFLSIGSRPVTLQLGTTFPQWAGAPQLQGMNREPRGWRSKPHKATDTMLDVAMFYCSPFPFKPRLLWVLPPELAAEANGRRSSQPITPESISVDVDHWRGRQQLAMKTWTQFQLARCDWQCGNLRMTAQAKWASGLRRARSSSSSVAVDVGRHRKQPRELQW